MQKVNKEEKEAEGGGCGRARQGVRAAAAARASVRTRAPRSKSGGRRKGGEAVKGRAAASARVPCAPKAQKGRAPRIVRARVVCCAPLYFAAASALFVKGVPVWLSQKAETPFLRRPCTAK